MVVKKIAERHVAASVAGALFTVCLLGCSSTSGNGSGSAAQLGAGDGGGGSGGVSGSASFPSCDMRTETSQNPITTACGDITTPIGNAIKLGTYGAIMDPNVGKGFENTVASSDVPGSPTCQGFASIFAEDPKLTAQLLDTASIDFSIYSVYRPATWPAGKVPVISWGNGTCAQPEGYGALLRFVASQGFFVVAANSRQVGTGKELLHALDFADAANKDPTSPYYQHLDLSQVGVMGHSQGSGAAALASSDPRVKYVILFNAGLSTAKPFLAISGDLDITKYTAPQMAASVNAAPQGAYLFYHNPVGQGPLKGHLVLMLSPERVTDAAANFWQMMFRNDAAAHSWFVGADCKLCNHSSDYEFGEHGL